MTRNQTFSILLLLATLVFAACNGAAPAPTVDVDAAVATALAATRAVEEQVVQAVQATLTANAPAGPSPAATPAATATATPVPPPATPTTPVDTPAPPATAAPTPTPLRIAESDVDGNDGNDFVRASSNSNSGRVVLLPGFDQATVEDTPTFRDFINLRVEVFDTRAGLYDGAGIDQVTFRIITDDSNGDVVWEKVEASAPFCAFGGNDPLCTPIDLRGGAQWPNPFGGRINNNVYLVQIDITPTEGDATQWRWRFAIDSPNLAAPEPAPNTARINRIWVQDGRYFVDFEAFGFTPQLPGQHVHFFFDNVPPEQAGVPGSGPWQLYPASAGQPGTSPFTLLTVASRPANASQMCILVANANHSINQGTGNCVDLP
jgi:hypothetical protein